MMNGRHGPRVHGWFLALTLILLVAVSGAPGVQASVPALPLPGEIRALGNDWQMMGSARFRKYFIMSMMADSGSQPAHSTGKGLSLIHI